MSGNYVERMRQFRGGGKRSVATKTARRAKVSERNTAMAARKKTKTKLKVGRNKKGQFVKLKRAAKKKPVKAKTVAKMAPTRGKAKKRTTAKRRVVRRKRPVAIAVAVAENPVRRRRRRHSTRVTQTKENPMPRRSRRRARHYAAYEANPVKNAEANKKKAAAKKAAAKKPVAKKPVAKKPVAKKPVAKKPVAKKVTAKKAAVRRRRRRLSTVLTGTTTRRYTTKDGNRHSRLVPSTIRIVVSPARKVAKKSRKGRKPKSVSAGEFMENPAGGFLENPLSGGELALAFLTAGLGYAATDFIGRYIATHKYEKSTTLTAAQKASWEPIAIYSTPDLAQIATQVGVAALPLVGAYFVNNPLGRSALQGFGLGAGVHLVGQLFKNYLLGKVLNTNATVLRLYSNEINADNAAASLSTDATYKAAMGIAGLPRVGVGYPTTISSTAFSQQPSRQALQSVLNAATQPGVASPPAGSNAVVASLSARPNAASINNVLNAAAAAAQGLQGLSGSQIFPE